MNWEAKSLDMVSKLIQTGPFGSQLHQSDYVDVGIPVIMPKDIINGKISEKSIARVSEDNVERLSRHKVKKGNIIYSRRGDVGRCAFITEHEENWLCGTGCLKVEIDTTQAEPRFVYYQLQMPKTVGWVINHAVGSTMLNLNTSILSKIPLQLPNLTIQKKIVYLLTSYDDLIENNQKQIKLLEEAAQRLYKEWFVDLHFPGYESANIVDGVPESWKKDKAENFFDITIGKTPPRSEQQWFVNGKKGIPWLSIADMGNANIFTLNTSEGVTNEAIERYNMKVVSAGTVLVSFKLTVGRVAIASTNMCTNEAIAHFYIDKDIQRTYVYCYLSNFAYDSLGNTSSISKAVNSKIIKAMPFVMPDDFILKEFSKCMEPIFNEIRIKQMICMAASEARDRLLPKLMSGEIEV